MYMYYLIASLLPKDEKTRKKYLWWGRYLTQMQMFQFFLNLLQAAYCWQFSPYPKFMSQVRQPFGMQFEGWPREYQHRRVCV